jgi:catechol 2,3-dioxygenase-like lactoylglutathione lyase family enzyme
MEIQFIATTATITADPAASRRLYIDALGLPLHGEDDGYQHSEQIAGSKSFGVWPLAQRHRHASARRTGLSSTPFLRPASNSR